MLLISITTADCLKEPMELGPRRKMPVADWRRTSVRKYCGRERGPPRGFKEFVRKGSRTGRHLSVQGTGLEPVTKQATVRYPYHHSAKSTIFGIVLQYAAQHILLILSIFGSKNNTKLIIK
ncbi:hypothetical protein TNCV_1114501 [Trichonephila clavipes]|nr:hypothetical protein TNCV_1114501 [Trichonephila clavipes]